MKIIQYIHKPNNTELGKGNTHETYMLISREIDLASMFPVAVDVKVTAKDTGAEYTLKSAVGNEFRVNQMGQIYRDYDVSEGDEIWLTKISGSDEDSFKLEIKKYQRIIVTVSGNGSVIGDIDRLASFGSKATGYALNVSDGSTNGSLSIVFDGAKKKRSDSPDTTDFYKVTFNGLPLKNGNYIVDLMAKTIEPFKKCSYNEIILDGATLPAPSFVVPCIPASHDNLFRALRTKPFLLLAGISGTGKSRIVRELAFRSCPPLLQDADHTTPGNYLIIEVKPNWHDSSELLGYYSNITKSYHFTKFIDFLVLAHANPDVPFFVCLDEMNLAPVEQYFAEFLSVLETRRYPKGVMTHIKTGRLVDKKYMVSHSSWGKDEDLTLPDNLFVIGTVNMDDTTHQFSRKVIDRAMTIEMNGGNLESMFGNSKNMDYTGEFTLNDFKPTYVNADEVLAKYGSYSIKEDAPAKLNAINNCLSGTPFEVSYRVLNELCIYIGVLLDSGVNYPDALEKAVDNITLMKILPRIEGDEDMFRTKGENNNKLEQLKGLFTEDTESYKKIQEMIDRLNNGFTRFWP